MSDIHQSATTLTKVTGFTVPADRCIYSVSFIKEIGEEIVAVQQTKKKFRICEIRQTT